MRRRCQSSDGPLLKQKEAEASAAVEAKRLAAEKAAEVEATRLAAERAAEAEVATRNRVPPAPVVALPNPSRCYADFTYFAGAECANNLPLRRKSV
jgi:hypothetical protein